MKRLNTKLASTSLAVAIAAAFAIGAAPAQAEQVTDTTAPFSAPANLDFRVVIPGFLRFRVGSVGATIDQITFTPLAASVGNSVAVAGTGGDAAGTGANVSVQANNGQVTITATNNSGGNGLGTGVAADGFINYSEIATTATLAQLPAPVLSNAGGTTSLPTLNAGKVTNRTGVWNYAYANTTIPSAGNYGTSAQGGRVTYTATTP